MEYAAVLLLFCLTAAGAVRLCITGKGWRTPAFCVALFVLLCAEPVGGNVKVAPSCIFLACVGAAYIGYKKDFSALLCALAVAVIASSSLFNAPAGFSAREAGYFCSLALCAVVNRPAAAGSVLAFGYVLGDTYSLFADPSLVFRTEVYSLDTVYAAIFSTVAALFVSAILRVSEGHNAEKHFLGNSALY